MFDEFMLQYQEPIISRFGLSARAFPGEVMSRQLDILFINPSSRTKVYQSLATFRGEAEFSTWLYRIVTNLSLNAIRNHAGHTRHDVAMIENSMLHSTDGVDEGPELRMHVERALHELPTMQRSVVLLRHFQGLSTKQVSRILNCTEGTVKTHLHRGLQKMKDKLQFLKDERI